VASPLVDIAVNAPRLRGFTQAMLESPEVAEAYAALLGALRLRRSLDVGNAVLVTSAEPGEGKTTVAACLAMTASHAGQTVLLIDGDLRRASLASAIGIAGRAGLIEILLGQSQAAAVTYSIAPLAGMPRAGQVSVLAGGRESATFLPAVDWSKARAEFRAIAESFDLVILDSPPILAANDALLLSSLVDGVLLVVGAGSANLDDVRHARQQLEPLGTPLIGAVLNRFEPNIHGRSDQPYRGYYNRSHR